MKGLIAWFERPSEELPQARVPIKAERIQRTLGSDICKGKGLHALVVA